MSLHSNQTANHILENWVYADAAARVAATGMVAADVGKIAYQTDSGEYFRLTDDSPVTWAPASGVFEQYLNLTASGSAIGSGIADFFGTNPAFSLAAASRYILQFECYFLKTTAGTVTWTLTNTQAPAHQNIHFEMSPLTGIVAPAGSVAANLSGDIVGDTTAAKALTATSGNLTTAVNHYMRMRVIMTTHATLASNIRLRATESAGTITPLQGSWQSCRLILPSVGTFVA